MIDATKAKLSTSELATFQEAVCDDCLNDDENDKLCYILGELAHKGECDGVYERKSIDENTGCFYRCMMRRTEEEVTPKNIIEWIGVASSEDVEEVHDAILGSWQYASFPGRRP